MAKTQTFLSRKEVAELIGVTSDALSRYKLPDPDAYIGETRGWLEDTILVWNANRPGRGRKGIPRKEEVA